MPTAPKPRDTCRRGQSCTTFLPPHTHTHTHTHTRVHTQRASQAHGEMAVPPRCVVWAGTPAEGTLAVDTQTWMALR